MNIWDYIKDKLFNKKKALPEPIEKTQIIFGKQEVPYTKKEAFDASLKVDIKPITLDYAIEQYMAALATQEKIGFTVDPYRTLIQLGGLENLSNGYNRENQEIFLENLNKGIYGNNARIIFEQKNDQTNETQFYHISNTNMKIEDIKYRIYLNCKKENVALLAHEFAEELKNQDYYFKFNGNDNKFRRSEQFVFYTENHEDLKLKIFAIDKIKQQNPVLFEGSNNVNPFMKTEYGYIAYAPDVKKGEYVDLKGNTHRIAQSYNTLLSHALEEAFIISMKTISKNELNFDMSLYKDLKQIVQSGLLYIVYEDPNLQMKFIEDVKKNLKLISERNPELDIIGIENKTRTQQKTNQNTMTQNVPENY